LCVALLPSAFVSMLRESPVLPTIFFVFFHQATFLSLSVSLSHSLGMPCVRSDWLLTRVFRSWVCLHNLAPPILAPTANCNPEFRWCVQQPCLLIG